MSASLNGMEAGCLGLRVWGKSTKPSARGDVRKGPQLCQIKHAPGQFAAGFGGTLNRIHVRFMKKPN